MTNSLFKHLLEYINAYAKDQNYTKVYELIIYNLKVICYSLEYLDSSYVIYLNDLNDCLLYILKNKYEELCSFLDDKILYWELSLNEEDY